MAKRVAVKTMPDKLEIAPEMKAKNNCMGNVRITTLRIIKAPIERFEKKRSLRLSNLLRTTARINPKMALPQRLLDTMALICAFVKCCLRMCRLKIIPYACPAKPVKNVKL